HKISPLGLLAVCSLVAAIGLFFLSQSVGVMILVAATIYGFGKAFFWPTMLGVVAERFPKGGALTLNIIGGLGMIAAGVIGAGIVGFIQDKSIDKNILAYDKANNTTLHIDYVTESKTSVFGDYQAIDQNKLAEGSSEDVDSVVAIQDSARKTALRDIVFFPIIMLVSYLALILFFRSRGGYKPVVIEPG